MADILTFKDKSMSTKSDSTIKDILTETLKSASSIEDLMLFIKTKDGDTVIYHSELSLADKSVFIQLLQHDIYNEISAESEINFELDL